MLLLITDIPRGMEKRPESASPRRAPRAGRMAKREHSGSPTSRGRRHKGTKTVRLPEEHEKKEGPKKETKGETDEEVDRPVKSTSTVVDVDNVREEERGEEFIALLESVKPRSLGVCEWLLMVLALTLVILFFPVSIWFCVKVVREHERAVIFRLGHLLRGRPRGPGLLFYLPLLDVCQKVDIRLKMLKVPPHTVVTKDLVSTELSAVCYYRIENVALCSTALSGVSAVLQALVQVADRDVLAHHNFTHILLDRKRIAQEIQVAIDSVACQWGIKVERAEIEDLSLPIELQHSLAAEAEAKRQAQIKVIAAEGERAACEALKASLDSLSGSPAAIHLRLLQLLHTLRTERPALVLTLPSDLLTLPRDPSPLTLPTPAPNLAPANPIPKGGETKEERKTDSPMM
ncbi:podocin isoform X2 [Coregonus clupeaformis]|uniref:podocin isoform X2 n=1 Tax=Coregonus clupeaformis TaxID=59861 RepID=UPI001E1C7925|nr:podocin isoform X2 [Coregonus clupeaformis]